MSWTSTWVNRYRCWVLDEDLGLSISNCRLVEVVLIQECSNTINKITIPERVTANRQMLTTNLKQNVSLLISL